jgi:hypothetical protein
MPVYGGANRFDLSSDPDPSGSCIVGLLNPDPNFYAKANQISWAMGILDTVSYLWQYLHLIVSSQDKKFVVQLQLRHSKDLIAIDRYLYL